MSNVLIKRGSSGIHETARGPYIGTFTGGRFYPMDVRPGDIKIEDISHALSNQCRFGGHVSSFYSVAQHSCLVSDYLAISGQPALALQGLLHDASEAYLVDVPRPIKHLADFTVYRRIERETQQVIYAKYGIEEPDGVLIHGADNLLLATEARDLMGEPSWSKDMPRLSEKITPWTPERGKREFMKRFEKLYDN